MFHLIIIIIALAGCNANAPAQPAAPQVYCGEIPGEIYTCLGNPTNPVFKDVAKKCSERHDAEAECAKMRCMFKEMNWMNGDQVNKGAVSRYFDQYAVNYPAWSGAVQYLKAQCLTLDLPAQGVYLNCPAYDVMLCVATSFIRGATPAQWASRKECSYPRSFAGACPVCPSACFAAAVPYGSCNACRSLPPLPTQNNS